MLYTISFKLFFNMHKNIGVNIQLNQPRENYFFRTSKDHESQIPYGPVAVMNSGLSDHQHSQISLFPRDVFGREDFHVLT